MCCSKWHDAGSVIYLQVPFDAQVDTIISLNGTNKVFCILYSAFKTLVRPARVNRELPQHDNVPADLVVKCHTEEGGHALPRVPGMGFLALTCMGMGKFS